MPSSTLFAAAAFAASVSAAFDPSSKTNVVTYWGQGPNQGRLVDVCQNQNVDIVNVAFVNVFPDQGPGGWPGTNFGNACYGDVYQHNGVDTDLLKTCPSIGPDVAACQQMGVKVFLSIGGGYPTNYYLQNDTSGQYFADFLWNSFGGGSSADIPRPWGTSVVDGFDFDIESNVPTNELQSGYAAMATRFRSHYAADTSKNYYISGSPQCIVPDAHFSNVIQQASFDFLFVQFYNTPQCSARTGINAMNGNGGGNDITFNNWNGVASQNSNVKIFLGLPASSAAANNDQNYYLTPKEAESLVNRFSHLPRFGGIMVWESTYSANNVICGSTYINWMKKILLNPSIDTTVCNTGTTTTTSQTSTTKTTSSSTSTTTVKTSSSSTSVTKTSTSSSSSTSLSSTTAKTSTSSSSRTSTSSTPVQTSTTTSKAASTTSTSATASSTTSKASTRAAVASTTNNKKRHIAEPTTLSTSCSTSSTSSVSTSSTSCTTSSSSSKVSSSSSSSTSCSTSSSSSTTPCPSTTLVPAPAPTKPSTYTAPVPAPYAQPSVYAPAPAVVPQNSTRPAPPAPYSPAPYTPSASPSSYTTSGAVNLKAAVGGVFAVGLAVVMLA